MTADELDDAVAAAEAAKRLDVPAVDVDFDQLLDQAEKMAVAATSLQEP